MNNQQYDIQFCTDYLHLHNTVCMYLLNDNSAVDPVAN